MKSKTQLAKDFNNLPELAVENALRERSNKIADRLNLNAKERGKLIAELCHVVNDLKRQIKRNSQ